MTDKNDTTYYNDALVSVIQGLQKIRDSAAKHLRELDKEIDKQQKRLRMKPSEGVGMLAFKKFEKKTTVEDVGLKVFLELVYDLRVVHEMDWECISVYMNYIRLYTHSGRRWDRVSVHTYLYNKLNQTSLLPENIAKIKEIVEYKKGAK